MEQKMLNLDFTAALPLKVGDGTDIIENLGRIGFNVAVSTYVYVKKQNLGRTS